MKLTLKQIPKQNIGPLWPVLEHFLSDAIEQASVTEYDTSHMKVLLEKGHWLAIGVFDEGDDLHGVVVVSFMRYPKETVAFITGIGGRQITNPDTFEQLKAICKSHGAVKLQGYARESVARLWNRLGFHDRAILVETKI